MTSIHEHLAEQKRLAKELHAEGAGTPEAAADPLIGESADGMNRLVAALEAVIGMHFPYRGPGDRDTCGSEICSNMSWGPEPWPCPTIRSVEAALGGASDDPML